MKRIVFWALSLALVAEAALAASVSYEEPPEETAMIRVEDGTTTVRGLSLYTHLTHWWTFDDAENPFADRIGGVSLAAVGEANEPVRKSGEDAKRGGAMWTGKGLKATSNVIDGRSPFTICFWYKYGDFSQTESRGQESILHVGKIPNGAQISDAPYFRVSHHNQGSPMQIDIWNNQCAYKASTQSSFVSGVWHHLSLTCQVIEESGCVTSNKFTIGLNGKWTAASATVAQQTYDVGDLFLLGMGYHYTKTPRPVYDATFDEVMCFDKALTATELEWVAADNFPPIDFSAGWDVAADGTLEMFGREPLTALKGEGVATTLDPMRLEASSNAWFAGVVRSPAFTYAGANVVTQTLSGANAWTGATTVASGTLEIAASPVCIFGDALVAWYPFEDPSNPGRDFSPRRNDLKHSDACLFEVSEQDAAGCGQALFLTNNTTSVGFYTSGCLKGLTPFANNSYTVAFWMRTDKWNDNSGPFSFASGQNPAASGFITKSSATSVRYGDSGNACSSSLPFAWGDQTWHHIAVVYDASSAAQGGTCHYLFVDGAVRSSSAAFNAGITNHAATAFNVGRGFSGSAIFNGAIDEVIVLNTANTNDVSKLYGFRRVQPASGTGVLPSGTVLTVEDGATLKLSGANETVAELYGRGTVDLSGNSKLTVTIRDRFDGTVVGGTVTDAPGAERRGLLLLLR